jgi:hypothetical protein
MMYFVFIYLEVCCYVELVICTFTKVILCSLIIACSKDPGYLKRPGDVGYHKDTEVCTIYMQFMLPFGYKRSLHLWSCLQ